MNSYEKKMVDLLRYGKDHGGVVATKAEFEAEGTRTDELLRLLEIANKADVGLALKIGGCEAIRDLLEAKQFGVRYIIAPMVETPYALSKYIAAKQKIFQGPEQSDVTFLFNIETTTSFKNIGLYIVSGRPPFFEIITAFPRDPDSREDLPKGSSHNEGTTVIDDLL